MTDQLIDAAIAARQMAYAPYSSYPVGAALQTKDGTIFTGCNIENASFGATICAERTAAVKAISEGYMDFETIAVVTRDGGSPCGICRQFLLEFAPNLRVIIADEQGHVHHDVTLAELIALGFSAASLKE